MFSRLEEEDFKVLRAPLESGRQSPANLGAILILSIFLQALMFALEYYVAGYSTVYPYKDEILIVHFWLTVGLIVLSLIYAIPAVYNRSGRIQYLISILVSQNMFSLCLLISALFFWGKDGDERGITSESLLNSTYIILAIGLLIFIVTCIRFYRLLQKGKYRKDSEKGELRAKFEFNPDHSMISIVVVGSVFIMQYMLRYFSADDINILIVIIIGIALFFAMLFVLPEQLVILYCKYRFKSFNFDERGYLNKQE